MLPADLRQGSAMSSHQARERKASTATRPQPSLTFRYRRPRRRRTPRRCCRSSTVARYGWHQEFLMHWNFHNIRPSDLLCACDHGVGCGGSKFTTRNEKNDVLLLYSQLLISVVHECAGLFTDARQ